MVLIPQALDNAKCGFVLEDRNVQLESLIGWKKKNKTGWHTLVPLTEARYEANNMIWSAFLTIRATMFGILW